MTTEQKLYDVCKELISKESPEVWNSIEKEFHDQRSNLKMIASENFTSPAVMACMATLLNDKYAEGYPEHRFYAGCENVDAIESLAAKTACEVFGAENAFVQPHCGADANMIAYWAVLNALCVKDGLTTFKKKNVAELTKEEWENVREECHNQRLLGMDYYSGGHLTHGYRQNISAQMFDCYSYGVDENGYIDYDALRKQVIEVDPLILLVGYSAYPRKINFKRMREIANETGAVLMVDMAHFAGLVAGKVFTGEYSPFPYADIVTTTTHKTLRGPRGGIVFCKDWLAESVNKACPIAMGGPLPHVMAAKAIALIEASKPEFEEYAHQVVKNSQSLANALMNLGITVATNGTDNHLLLVDVSKLPAGINGKQAEFILRECGITCNRNALPNDPNGPWYTSGVRLGTPALTTLGMKEPEMEKIAKIISDILTHAEPSLTKSGKISKNKAEIKDKMIEEEIHRQVGKLLKEFKLYPGINI